MAGDNTPGAILHHQIFLAADGLRGEAGEKGELADERHENIFLPSEKMAEVKKT
jgi:hypothetical protein